MSNWIFCIFDSLGYLWMMINCEYKYYHSRICENMLHLLQIFTKYPWIPLCQQLQEHWWCHGGSLTSTLSNGSWLESPAKLLESQPPHFPLTKFWEQISRQKFTLSHGYKVKAYADDLTVNSQSAADHQLTLTDIDNKCLDIRLQIHPGVTSVYLLSFGGRRSLTGPLPRPDPP